MFTANGTPLPLPVTDSPLLTQWFAQQAPSLLARWSTELQHQLRENGASVERWHTPTRQLDIFPWIIDEAQWHWLSSGITQRHRLLAKILADLYGPQQLLAQGIIPVELLFNCPDFLPECHGLLTTPEQWLPLLATDIAPLADGGFCAFADTCKTPAGLGFALEHRLALKQHIPELSQWLPKQQLAGFFRLLQHTVQGNDTSLTAILTHGTRDAAYFEHAYLANYLDVALVQGADLMYSEQRIWLKTLSGLKPVGALLRYLDDQHTDPLELEHAAAGIAGLLQSIRQQQIICANPPGAALLDSGILLPFMEAAADFLLDAPLILPSVPAFWAQQSAALPQVFAAPDTFFMHDLKSGQQGRAQYALLEQSPADYIVRKQLPLLHRPCYNLYTGSVMLTGILRTFSLYPRNGEPVLLPGAFSRLGEADHIQLPLNNQLNHTELSKDVWVLGQDAMPAESLLQSHYAALTLSREAGLLPSRVANHLFWLGRYNERLNLLTRALRVALPLLSHPLPEQHQTQLHCFIDFCLTANGGEPVSQQQSVSAALTQLFSPNHPLSVIALLKNLVYNAQSVREYFSDDAWYLLDKLQATVYQWPAEPDLQHPMAIIRLLDDVVMLQTAFYGMNNETMSRTQALRFMDIGQHLERAWQTSSLLERVFVHTQPDASLMEALLRMADTLMTYRRRYRTALNPVAIIDLLLLDTTTPRSVGYQITRLRRQTAELPDLTTADRQRLPALTEHLANLITELNAQQLITYQQPSAELGAHLQHIQHLLRQLSDELSLCYFTHAHLSRPWSTS